MKFLHILLLSFIFTCLSPCEGTAQIRFAKYPVEDTKCHIYLPAAPEWQLSYSEDSSRIYISVVEIDSISFCTFVIELKESLADDRSAYENVLLSFMAHLNQNVFEVTNAMEPGMGHTLESNPKAVGVIQYAEDAEGNQMKVKGWADPHHIAVLYVISKSEVAFNIQEMFLNGFRFPE